MKSTPITTGFGEFEKHTKKIGSKLLLNDGWVKGKGIDGGGREGRIDPIMVKQRKISDRRGIGSHSKSTQKTE
eukprot:Pgem_evm1s16870